MITVAWQLCRRHWAVFYALAFWFAMPSLALVMTADLAFALRFSWMIAVPFTVYMYRATSGSQLLGILPLSRSEVWQITFVVGALAPAAVQLIMGLTIWMLAHLLLPASTDLQRVPAEAPLLGAVYSLACLQLVLIATASLRRQRLVPTVLAIAGVAGLVWFTDVLPVRISEFTATAAITFWAAVVAAVVLLRSPGALAAPVPARIPSYRLTLDFPHIGVFDRLTGVKRILLAHTVLGTVCFGGALLVASQA